MAVSAVRVQSSELRAAGQRWRCYCRAWLSDTTVAVVHDRHPLDCGVDADLQGFEEPDRQRRRRGECGAARGASREPRGAALVFLRIPTGCQLEIYGYVSSIG